MSLQILAQHLREQGRGNDTELMHVTPKELSSLQTLAQSHGGSLTINPRTGLPEAGFLESILPTVVGAGVGIATGNPFIGAAVGGGLGMAANGGNLQAGLTAGLGAYGFGSLGAGLAATGAGALTAEAGAEAAALNAFDPAIQGSASGAFDVANAAGAGAAEPSTWDSLTKGFETTKFDKNYLKDNMFPIGMGVAGLLGGSMLNQSSDNATTDQTGMIRPYTYSQTKNPNYAGAGTPYWNQSYTAGTPYAAPGSADGGIVAMAEGGIAGLSDNRAYPMANINKTQYATPSQMPTSAMAISSDYDALTDPYLGNEVVQRMAAGGVPQAVTDYNNMLMQRAQQEYVNSPPLAAMIPRTTIAPQPVNLAPAAPQVAPQALPSVPLSEQDAWARDLATRDWSHIGGAANGGLMTAGGGISSLGSYSDGGQLLKGPGDGVSDEIPAQIGDRQPARLADGEFVVPSRVVSELGNGSTDAGAKRLYAMMDRVQNARKKSIGKGKLAVDSKADKYLPA